MAGVYFNRQDIRGSSLGTADGNAQRDSWSQVASVEYPFGGVFKLQGGYRFDHDSAFGNKWSPQVAGAWKIRNGLSASASLTRGFRAPDFSELYLNNTHAGGRVRVLGNVGLRPEQSWSGSAGVLFAPRQGWRVEGQLFEHRLEDMILSRLDRTRRTGQHLSIHEYRRGQDPRRPGVGANGAEPAAGAGGVVSTPACARSDYDLPA